MQLKDLQLKRALRTALLVLLLNVVGMGKMYAQWFTVGDLNYQVNNDGISVTVTGHVDGQSATGSLVIPETVEHNGSTYTVTTIGNYAFRYCSGLTGSLTVPNSVTAISESAFEFCSGFTGDLDIPNSVTEIGDWAFTYCSGFTGGLTISNSVTTIGDGVFYGCSGFTGSLVIPNSVTEIGEFAFTDCSGFTGGLTISNSVTTIGDEAFDGCSGFTGSLVIPNSVTEIGEFAFAGCSGFSSLACLAETPPSLGNDPFSSFYYSNKPVYVPCGYEDEYASLSWGGFNDFIGLCGGSVTVMADPDEYGTVTGGGQFEAYQLCTVTATPNEGYVFTYWTINGMVVSVEAEYTFYVTGDMTLMAHFVQDGSIVFADANVKSICVANWDTNGDGELSYDEAAAVTGLGQVFRGNTEITSFEELQFFIGLTSIGDYTFCNCINLTGNLYIPNSVTTIGRYAFSGCNGLTGNLTIPNSVTTIGYRAFQNCSGFTGNLTIGNSVTTIHESAFFRCSGFNNLTIGNSVTTIEGEAFLDCNGFNSVYYSGSVEQWCSISFGLNPLKYAHNLYIDNSLVTNLVIPETITEIKNGAFSGATCLTSLTIGNSVTVIGNSAFFGCSGLTGNLTIPNSVTTIGERAFQNCSGFTGSLTIGNSVTTIGDEAFDGCSGFTGSLVIPNSVTTIGNFAFSRCRSFTEDLVIPNSVTTIGDWTFSGCSGFNGLLTIPDSVTTIGEFAFLACNGFTGSLTIPNSVTTIGSYAFYNCSGFTGNLIIPNSVTTIGESAFGWCFGLSGDLILPNSLTTISDETFYYCLGFTGKLTIPNSVTSIGNKAFFECSGLTGNLYIPNSVTTIGDWAFQNCSGFTGNLIIGNSVTSIGTSAFVECSGFTGILTIPYSVDSIGNYAFSRCSGLSEVMMFGTTPASLGNNSFYNTDFPIYVPYESLNEYKIATNWSVYESRIFPMAYTTITGYGEGEGNYRFIASPLVENTAPTAVNNMITETPYDLYRFDQSEDAEWQNYEFPENTPNFFLTNGQGYLYANAEDVNLIFKGEFNEDETKEVELAYEANAEFAGWNLVGNPFPVSAYANKSYYTMNEDGTAVEPNMVSSATAIPTCTGVMVKAEAQGETVVFNTTTPETASNKGCVQIALSQVVDRGGVSTSSTTLQDKAIVSFNAGDRLEKFVFNKDNAKISIPQGGKDLAIACAEKQGELPLNFKAMKNGTYTLSVDVENADVDYLHLIDNLKGADVDLLVEPSYSFEATPSDYASRFKLVFASKNDALEGTESFGYFADGRLVIPSIEGVHTLQVIDMLGHIVLSENVTGSYDEQLDLTPGVYVVRLNERTQKMVVK